MSNWSQFQYDSKNTGNGEHVQGPKGVSAPDWNVSEDYDFNKSVILVDETIYATASSGKLIAFSADDGTIEETIDLQGSVYTSPIYHNGTVYVISNTPVKVVAIDESRKEKEWEYTISKDPFYSVFKEWVVDDGLLFVTVDGFKRGFLSVIDINGKSEKWREYLGGLYSSPTSPAVDEERIHVGVGKNLYGLNVKDGSIDWKFDAKSLITSAPTIADKRSYVTSTEGIHAVDTDKGTEIWTKEFENRFFTASGAVGEVDSGWESEKVLCFTAMGDRPGALAINASDGSTRWTVDTEDSKMPPSIVDGVAYLGDGTEFYALTLSDGESRWETTVDHAGEQSPAVLNEKVYLTTTEGITTIACERIEASAAAVSFIPGGNENSSEGGHPLNSSLMQIFKSDDDISEVNIEPVIDNWGMGDMVDTMPQELENARVREEGKYEEAPGTAASNFRILSEIEVSFCRDFHNSILQDTIKYEFGQSTSKSGLEGEDLNNLKIDEWFNGKTFVKGVPKPRYYKIDTQATVDGTDAIRISTISGGYTKYLEDVFDIIIEKGGIIPFLEELWDTEFNIPAKLKLSGRTKFLVETLAAVPNIYTFMELYVLADERRFLRVWDMSAYPKHAIYLDGEKQKSSVLNYSTKERFNPHLMMFGLEAIVGHTVPYGRSEAIYWDYLNNDILNTGRRILSLYRDLINEVTDMDDDKSTIPRIDVPRINIGTDTERGTAFSEEEIVNILPSNPLKPFENKQ